MVMHNEGRIEPAPEIVAEARRWLDAVRPALGAEFVAAYMYGSVLTRSFDFRRSRVNVLVVARNLSRLELLDQIAAAIPDPRKPPRVEAMFVTRTQIERSLDSFAIEWLDIQERHLRLDGEDVFGALEIPRESLRLQLEHELRGKHIQLRQAYLLGRPAERARLLALASSSFAALFRTLLRLNGETPPADNGRVVERLAEIYELNAQGLLGAHLQRVGGKAEATVTHERFQRFLTEIERLIDAIDVARAERSGRI